MKTATIDGPTERTQATLDVKTMQAIVQVKYGSADVLHLRDVHLPAIGDHDVLIRVRAAAVNPADWAIMGGLPYIARPAPMYGVRTPKNGVRGTDVAGRVAAVGSAVTRFRAGDDVFGWCRGAGRFQMQNRRVPLSELRALIGRRQETGAPVLRPAHRLLVIQQDHERRQIAIR